MCTKQWDKIDFSKVPSCAIKRLKKAFAKNATTAFAEWKSKLVQKQVTVNSSQLFPYELVKEMRTTGKADEVCVAQWSEIERKLEESGVLRDCVAVIDTSASMGSPNHIPMDVSVSLGMLIAQAVKGPFHGQLISFHETPNFTTIRDGNVFDRYQQVKHLPWGGSTNIQSVFDMILNRGRERGLSDSDMPKRLFIVSDMQFDSACGRCATNFEVIKQKYAEHRYTMPQIVFWNVNGKSTDFPVSVQDDGTALISGFSPSIMKSVLIAREFNPYSIMRNTLDSDRYSEIVRSLS
jgi:hypothetical protein